MTDYQNNGYVRPRSRTALSFGSSRSGGPKFTKEELVETPSEKAAKRMSTKANPNVAMLEVEPVVQALMRPTMDSNLRGMQHRDMYGNIITDPDRSNPTRPRMERPLDTIRSFEAAIDGKYGRMSTVTETPGPSRPVSAYFGGMDNSRRKSSAGLSSTPSHANRSGRPESYVDSSMYGSANRRSPAPFGGPPRRGFGPGNRNNSDPVLYGNGTYSQPRREPHHASYDSAGSSGGSGGTENWNPSTDPSSLNSSVDKFQPQPAPPPPPKHDLGEQYGFSGFGDTPQTNLDYTYQQQPQQQYQQQNGYANQYPDHNVPREDGPPPPPPPHKGFTNGPQPRGVLSKTPSYGLPAQPQQRPETGEKRKSWLMRRLSRNP